MAPALPYDRTNWPIAAAMIHYPNMLPDGSSVQDQTAEQWAATRRTWSTPVSPSSIHRLLASGC